MELLPQLTEAAEAVATFVAAWPVPSVKPDSMPEFAALFGELDKQSSALLAEHLDALRPGVPWAAEMRTEVPERGEVWIVDTVDGAVQLLQGLPQWCVSVTLVRDREPVATVLHSLVLGATYAAERSRGAFRNGSPITPSTKTDLSVCLVATSQPPTVADEPVAIAAAGRSLSAVLPHVGAVRNLGPTTWQLADTAAGRIDAFWEFGLDEANLLPGALLAREAGALVTNLDGQDWKVGDRSFLAAPAGLHGQLLALLAQG
ncbi:inositol monophosphatase family protein [Kutzneria sp. CA-103260]|uniref:inositol monophosphatase family protein n=1 Tax=Kutzneria sp. CA-103260 TaxID=2802641 RepID=UPI001BEDA3FE|nr:inositol monophosphatase [Kutzneria sp. CA-103260]QUQ63395.1 3'(2'),5'-bisphosphate nucleotidase CysQ [Kutzneria sp. CA-103260]